MKNVIVLFFSVAAFVSCAGGGARVSGRFAGCGDKPVTLQRLSVASDAAPVDTAVTDRRGRFAFKVELPAGQPTLYTLRHAGNEVTLLLGPGDRVHINCVPGINRYTISGSAESELIKEVADIMSTGLARLDSISNSHLMAGQTAAQRNEVMRSYVREYRKIKQEQIRFIVEHSGTLAAVYALYQRLPNDDVLFTGDQTDILYYRMVADSVEKNYPGSPYVASLRSVIAQADSENAIASRLEQGLKNPVPYPEISMTDVYGRRHDLSDLHGKVILLDFWSAAAAESTMANAELRELYDKYRDRGFEIYQVAVDESKPVWVNAVLDQKLPWITVCDFRGSSCPAVMNYRVTGVPAGFLIDREGNVVARNLWGEELAREVEKLVD